MIPEKVKSVLENYGLMALEFEEGSTPTAEKAAEKIGVAVGQIAKSILLKGKDDKYRMVVLAGDKKISSSKIKKLTGVKHSMTSAEETRRVTGFSPGGVCPFGVDNIEIFIDQSLEEYDKIYPAAGTDATGVPMTFEQLLAITGGSVCDVSS
ncbi:MAG: YbaK/EbsC family protein [Spirochaetes bacterium]|nr:MAG: YbaK/EbsC family protein [Spirochaetota bacterium]